MVDIRSKAVTVEDYSSVFATFGDCSPLFALFETIGTIRNYSLFATIRFAIWVFKTPFEQAFTKRTPVSRIKGKAYQAMSN